MDSVIYKIQVGYLGCGEVFKYDGTLFMVTDREGADCRCLCVVLEEHKGKAQIYYAGSLEEFDPRAEVEGVGKLKVLGN